MTRANPYRGEVEIELSGEVLVLRPSFAALVEIEADIGSLIALVERAAAGELALTDIVMVLWACLKAGGNELDKDDVGRRVVETGIANVTKPLRDVLAVALSGHAGSERG